MIKNSKKILSLFLSLIMIMSMFTGLEVSSVAEDDILSYLTYEINDGEVTITMWDRSIGGHVVIPETIEGYPVTAIGETAFFECSITSISIPDSVKTIGVHAFSLSGLESIIIPDGVTTISDGAFNTCLKLKSVEIPDSVTTIGYGAFTCTPISSIKIPANVTEISDWAFAKCGYLTSITIPDGVTRIGSSAFWYSGLLSITIPNTVTSIGAYAFLDCDDLESITIPASVTSIGEYAFDDEITIYGTSDTAAETYAKENDITFIPIHPQIPDKLEVSDKNIKVDEKEKTVTFGQKNTVEGISKVIKNSITAIFGKDDKELGKSDLVGTGAEIRIMDNSGKILSRYTVCVPTDVDGNGKTTAADARLALRSSAKLEKIEGVYAQASDVTGDGKITAADARKILRISAGLEKA